MSVHARWLTFDAVALCSAQPHLPERGPSHRSSAAQRTRAFSEEQSKADWSGTATAKRRPEPQQQSSPAMSRVNRGNPSLAAGSASGIMQGSAAAGGGGGGGGAARTGQRGGYAGAAGSSGTSARNVAGSSSGSEWASPAAGRPPSTSALKPSGAGAANNPTSPNPYAPAFNPAGPASPWSAAEQPQQQACKSRGARQHKPATQ